MHAQTFPKWKGFEVPPHGCLLEQVVDLSGEMGFAYERSCEFYKDFHTHDRLMLIFPRGASAMEVRTLSPKRTLHVDSSGILIVPKGLEHDDEGVSSIYDTIAFYPSDDLLRATAKKLGVSSAKLSQTLDGCAHIKRTPRLEQLAQEYFFEKVVTREPADREGLEYLGRKLVEELFRQLFSVSQRPEKDSGVPSLEGTVVSRAVRFIESNLFQDLELDLISKRSGASVSTLLRKFKLELGQTPWNYIRSRRLEEAHLLLETGSYSVSEVALLVGYENLGAFSEAFKEKYGMPPSQLKHPLKHSGVP